ncbi:MAG: hypothetical protein AB1750_07245 [Chloroflexota bacterium]
MSDASALAGRIPIFLEDVKRSVERAVSLGEKAKQSGDDGYWDGAALNLHGFYNGVERIFEDIARTLEKEIPDSEQWHIDLLAQMAGEIEGLRPAVITRETRNCLDAYRGFRHVVRNVYAFNLRPARLNDLVNDLPGCFESVQRDLKEFKKFLEGID